MNELPRCRASQLGQLVNSDLPELDLLLAQLILKWLTYDRQAFVRNDDSLLTCLSEHVVDPLCAAFVVRAKELDTPRTFCDIHGLEGLDFAQLLGRDAEQAQPPV